MNNTIKSIISGAVIGTSAYLSQADKILDLIKNIENLDYVKTFLQDNEGPGKIFEIINKKTSDDTTSVNSKSPVYYAVNFPQTLKMMLDKLSDKEELFLTIKNNMLLHRASQLPTNDAFGIVFNAIIKTLSNEKRFELIKQQQDGDLKTPIHCAIRNFNIAFAENLLDLLSQDQRKEIFKIQDSEGNTLLHLIVNRELPELTKKWLSKYIRRFPDQDIIEILKIKNNGNASIFYSEIPGLNKPILRTYSLAKLILNIGNEKYKDKFIEFIKEDDFSAEDAFDILEKSFEGEGKPYEKLKNFIGQENFTKIEETYNKSAWELLYCATMNNDSVFAIALLKLYSPEEAFKFVTSPLNDSLPIIHWATLKDSENVLEALFYLFPKKVFEMINLRTSDNIASFDSKSPIYHATVDHPQILEMMLDKLSDKEEELFLTIKDNMLLHRALQETTGKAFEIVFNAIKKLPQEKAFEVIKQLNNKVEKQTAIHCAIARCIFFSKDEKSDIQYITFAENLLDLLSPDQRKEIFKIQDSNGDTLFLKLAKLDFFDIIEKWENNYMSDFSDQDITDILSIKDRTAAPTDVLFLKKQYLKGEGISNN